MMNSVTPEGREVWIMKSWKKAEIDMRNTVGSEVFHVPSIPFLPSILHCPLLYAIRILCPRPLSFASLQCITFKRSICIFFIFRHAKR